MSMRTLASTKIVSTLTDGGTYPAVLGEKRPVRDLTDEQNEALRGVVRDLLRSRWEENKSTAAAAFGVHPSAISGFLSGRQGFSRVNAYRALALAGVDPATVGLEGAVPNLSAPHAAPAGPGDADFPAHDGRWRDLHSEALRAEATILRARAQVAGADPPLPIVEGALDLASDILRAQPNYQGTSREDVRLAIADALAEFGYGKASKRVDDVEIVGPAPIPDKVTVPSLAEAKAQRDAEAKARRKKR